MKKIYKFYLENFKSIHHLISIGMIIGFSFIFGIQHLLVDSPIYQIFSLVICYFWTEYSLKKVGLTDESIDKELKEISENEGLKKEKAGK